MMAAIALSTAGLQLVELRGDQLRVAVHAKDELGQVIGADGEPVEELGERIGEDRIGGNLGHHVHLEAVVSAREPVGGEQVEDALAFARRPAEGDHQLDVRESHPFAHPEEGPALEGEGVAVPRMRVAEGAAEPEHGIAFDRLEVRGHRAGPRTRST